MVLKVEELSFGDLKITVRQLSFAGQLKLEQMGENKTFVDVYKECIINYDDINKLNVNEGMEVAKAVNRVNGWGKEELSDFQEPLLTSESGK